MSARHLACSALVLLALAPPAEAARYRLEGGGFAACAGIGRSANHAGTGSSGDGLTAERSSSDNADVIGGVLGRIHSPIATVEIETAEREFVSIAFPVQPSDFSVASVLSELGEPDDTAWRLGHWSPEDSSYVDAEEDLEALERGEGYYLITAEELTVDASGLTTPLDDYTIDLEDGPEGRPAWNQLGNPFTFPVAVAELMVTDGNTTVPLLSPENTLTEASVKVYDGETGAYVSDPALIEPFAGFWVRKLAPGTVGVVVPYSVGTEPDESVASKPAGATWALAVSARQGNRTCEPLLLGAAPVGAGWNGLSRSLAPDPPGRTFRLSVREADWGRLSGDYVRVFRPAAAATRWRVAARGVESPGEVTLAFHGIDLPAGARIRLADPAHGRVHEVQSGEAITLAASPTMELEVTVVTEGGPAAPRVVDGLSRVYPNPFAARCGLVFTLAGTGAIAAEIYDVSGRRVRELSAPATTSGERVLVWDGRDTAGRALPPGVYMARYRVGESRGVARLVKVE